MQAQRPEQCSTTPEQLHTCEPVDAQSLWCSQ